MNMNNIVPIRVFSLFFIADPNDVKLEEVLSFCTVVTRLPIGGFD